MTNKADGGRPTVDSARQQHGNRQPSISSAPRAPKAASISMRSKGLGIFSPVLERKPISLVCIDADVAQQLHDSRGEIADLRRQLQQLESERQQVKTNSPRPSSAVTWPDLEDVQQVADYQKLQETVALLQKREAGLHQQIATLQAENSTLTSQVQQHSALQAQWLEQQQKYEQEMDQLRQMNSKLMVYSKDSSMLRALRAAECQLHDAQSRNAQLVNWCMKHNVPLPDEIIQVDATANSNFEGHSLPALPCSSLAVTTGHTEAPPLPHGNSTANGSLDPAVLHNTLVDSQVTPGKPRRVPRGKKGAASLPPEVSRPHTSPMTAAPRPWSTRRPSHTNNSQ